MESGMGTLVGIKEGSGQVGLMCLLSFFGIG